LRDRHVVFHVGENGRLDEVALVANAIPTGDELGVLFFPVLM